MDNSKGTKSTQPNPTVHIGDITLQMAWITAKEQNQLKLNRFLSTSRQNTHQPYSCQVVILKFGLSES
jgi:hypothetical protein